MVKRAIGMMSGTSLDGIDLVLVKIQGVSEKTTVEVLKQETIPFDGLLVEKIKEAMDIKTSNVKLLTSLNVELGEVFARAVLAFYEREQIQKDEIDFIASHGQTIYHIAKEEDGIKRSSLQLGEGAVISHLCETTVVANFRLADIAAGGQGAPLVPYADYVLFQSVDKNRALHNIGGIANMTFLKKAGTIDDVIAFDSGPGNMMIDRACQLLYNKPYDKDGEIASKGNVIAELYDEVMSHSYFKQTFPKSTGREMFGDSYVDALLKKYQNHKKADLIHTLSLITVDSIVQSYTKHIRKPLDELILCGGGAHNKWLLTSIQKKMPQTNVTTLETLGYSSDYKEALAFVILANQTLKRLPSNVKSATGATKDKILGQIHYFT